MLFRHEFVRKGQMELIEEIKKTVEDGKVGFFEAPTGLGKTDAALTATLEFALQQQKKIFFVTPKNSQHKIVVDVIAGINNKYGTEIRAVDFVSKPNLCTDPFLYSGGSEFYELCEKKIARNGCIGYLNTFGKNKEQKVNAYRNIEQFKQKYKAVSHDVLRERCLDDQILCPYELSLILAKDANVVITDVNHVFLPTIRQKFLMKMNADMEDCIFIFDEAHNLPNRIKNSLSASINKKLLENALKELQRLEPKLKDDLEEFIETFHNWFMNLKSGFVDYNAFDELFAYYNYDAIINTLSKSQEFTIEKYETKSHLGTIAEFLIAWFDGKESKARYVDARGTLCCQSLDPAVLSKPVFSDCYAGICMSATLTPFEMYVDLLGIERETVQKRFSSPFPEENKLVLYSQEITTKYEERKENIPKICDVILNTVNSVAGNIAVFFPSYKLLNEVLSCVEDKTSKKIFVQQPEQTPQQAKRLVENFKEMKNTFGGVLFAVIGGSFAEGVDYPGDELIGIIVVGLPFPEPDYEMQALIDYYEKKYKNGWDYAYVFPTISKIVQGAGRAIRTETDRAFILLLDKRYSWSKYKTLFPKDFNFSLYSQERIHRFIKNN